MRHFFTKNTVVATIWCTPCHKETLWQIAGGRPGYCIECYEKGKNTAPKEQKPAEPDPQRGLFE